jgi:hypothetical protein
MLNRGWRSQLLLIKVRQFGHGKIVIPISLNALEQLLRAVFELLEVFRDLTLIALYKKERDDFRQPIYRISEGVKLFWEFWKEIRRYGSWRLVEIDNDRVGVEVRFF